MNWVKDRLSVILFYAQPPYHSTASRILHCQTARRMTKADIVDLIEAKYSPMAQELKHAWAENSKLRIVKKGEILVHEGERSTDLWLVATGVARAIYSNDGKRICDWFAFETDYICAISSFYQDKPRLSATETMLRLQEKIVSIQFESAQRKLENLLEVHPNIYQRVPLGDIASYLGMTQETLSRIRSEQVRI